MRRQLHYSSESEFDCISNDIRGRIARGQTDFSYVVGLAEFTRLLSHLPSSQVGKNLEDQVYLDWVIHGFSARVLVQQDVYGIWVEDDVIEGAERVVRPVDQVSSAKGFLIVLEGLDGAGTTTQAKRLVEYLKDRGHLTCQPSGGPIGRLIREYLAGSARAARSLTLAMLFAADRLDHMDHEVEPLLAQGRIVVSDRWYHSSLAYQGPDVGRERVNQLNGAARVPDLTIFLQVRAEVAAARRVAAGRAEELFDDLQTQRRVEEGYYVACRELSKRGDRIEMIDGEQEPAAVFREVLACVEALMGPGTGHARDIGAQLQPTVAREPADEVLARESPVTCTAVRRTVSRDELVRRIASNKDWLSRNRYLDGDVLRGCQANIEADERRLARLDESGTQRHLPQEDL